MLVDDDRRSAGAFAQHQGMLHVLGLQHVLPFACPTISNGTSTAVDRDGTEERNSIVLEDLHTKRSAQRLWSAAWLDAIRSKAVSPTASSNDIVIHIRRGDVSVCDAATRERYLPNAHYLHLIEEVLAGDRNTTSSSVVIYSENTTSATKNQEESWRDFDSISPTFRFDTSPADAWRAMLQARVLILSKSSFSIIPALFNVHGTIVYTPFWVPPLPSWRVVDDATDRQAKRTNIRLQHTLCET